MAYYRIRLLDNQNYCFQDDENGNHLLCSQSDRVELQVRKEWLCRQGWDNLASRVSQAFAEHSVLFLRDNDYEHTSQTFFTTDWKGGNSFGIQTGNLIGVVQSGNDTIEIGSRFGDDFLKYIVADADGFLSVPKLGGKTDHPQGYHWLLAFLWSSHLKRACRLGLPKAYHSERECLNRIRGSISPISYQMGDIVGKWDCSYRELNHNTQAAALFSEAYRIITATPGCAVFCADVHNVCQLFMQAICGKRLLRRDLLHTPHFSNVFYSDYNEVIDLSIKILRFWGSDFSGAEKSESIFFDVAMLFEFFVRKLLKKHQLKVRPKNDGILFIPSCPLRGDYKRKLIPDLIIDYEDGIGVFDVKYKYYDADYGVSREDLFQLHTYIGQFGNNERVRRCGFIYPIKESRWNKLRNEKMLKQVIIKDEITQQDRNIEFSICFIVVPDSAQDKSADDSWGVFRHQMDCWSSLFAQQFTSNPP